MVHATEQKASNNLPTTTNQPTNLPLINYHHEWCVPLNGSRGHQKLTSKIELFDFLNLILINASKTVFFLSIERIFS